MTGSLLHSLPASFPFVLQDCANLLWALAALGDTSSALFRAVWAQAVSISPKDFNPDGLKSLFQVPATAGLPPPPPPSEVPSRLGAAADMCRVGFCRPLFTLQVETVLQLEGRPPGLPPLPARMRAICERHWVSTVRRLAAQSTPPYMVSWQMCARQLFWAVREHGGEPCVVCRHRFPAIR